MLDKYRHYFDIDPEYFPQVNEAEIKKYPDLWKKFYPHETFVKLIKDTISIITRQQKLSIWVEGAYGTGKSHAVLTLKKLLDASPEDTHAYFENYPDQLSDDLYKQFQRVKSGDQKIITVHRYGSSKINDDNALVFALQESIVKSLEENGIKNAGAIALRDSTIEWLSQNWAKSMFNNLIQEKYNDLFSGEDVDTIIDHLKNYDGDSLITLMSKITMVADREHFTALSLDVKDFVKWVKDVIKENNLKAIVFIWDEFTDYFRNNLKALTGFQEIVDISGSDPFYMIIVTHKSAGLFSDTDKDQQRILDRFIKPTCNITLPENMAFRLMGSAMVKKKDTAVLDDWNDAIEDLYDRTHESRQLVKQKAHISDKELQNILPIHPYAALLLKHISSAFDSNQRSMFDFIKNDRGEEIKGFQWFIDNYGPEDDNPFLTVDMLWDFFYEKGKEYLSSDIRSILDCFSRALTKQLTLEEQRVLRAVLLMEAISHKVGDAVDLFIPNEINVNNAFEGSDLDIGAASRIAEKLCREEILYRKPLGNNKYQFSALINVGNTSEIEKIKEDQMKKTTSSLILEGEIDESIILTGALKLRYNLEFVSHSDLKSTIGRLRNQENMMPGKISAIVAVAKNDSESATISKNIESFVSDNSYNTVFIDASITPLGNDIMEQYAEAMANAKYQRGKDNALASQYEINAKEALKKWKNNITAGEFIVSYRENDGNIKKIRATSIEQLYDTLKDISKHRFPCCLETGEDVIDNMWSSSALKQGVECGATEVKKGTFGSGNEHTNLENYIGKDVWKQPEDSTPYWESKKYLLISKIKNHVTEIINESFKKDGRVSIATIYDSLKLPPFGFLPCNLTAFVMGFILKEYVNGVYTWSDKYNNDELTVDKLKEMVGEVISLQNTPNPRYRDKYIVKLTEEEKAFNKASSKIFNIPLNQCTNVENTREHIRNEMKKLSFPIWSLKYLKSMPEIKTNRELIEELIDLYSGIANSQNISGSKTDNDIALSIGSICAENPDVVDDASIIFTKDKCVEGMVDFLSDFEDGILPELAKQIDDNGQYINVLKSKFDADAANWVWNQETAKQKIKEVILEYKITNESNKVITKTIGFKNTIHEWSEKANYIRMSFPAAKTSLGDLEEFMQHLYEIKKSGTLLDSRKQKFYDALVKSEDLFREFYSNQIDLFKTVCAFYIEPYGFTDNEIDEIYKTLPTNCIIKEKSEYLNLVQTKVAEFNTATGNATLKKLWFEKTHTESPRDWSNQYKMPILALVDDSKIQEAKDAFSTINRSKSDSSSIEKALDFLKNDALFEKLNNSEERDKAFERVIIRQYITLLTDINEVKEYLNKVISAEPYEWFGLPEVDKKLQNMAEAKYNQGGCDKALEKINNMETSELKRYLKDLVKDNMTVGMEIIKEN